MQKINKLYVARYNKVRLKNNYGIVFNDTILGSYIDLYRLAIKIVDNEKPDSKFEENLIQYIDSCEPLFEMADEIRFDNLKNIINDHNVPLIIGVIESALNVKIIKLSKIIEEET